MNTPAEYEATKATLIATDPDYRELLKEHHLYEARLHELSAIHFPTPEEQDEEQDLKLRKLKVKDKMEALLRQSLASTAT
ncbi:MAG: YdcH family protein [Acidobacteriota bacterium]